MKTELSQTTRFRRTLADRLNVIQKFSLISFVGIALLVVGLGYGISHFLTENMLRREGRVTSDLVRTIVRRVVARERLQPSTAMSQDRLQEMFRDVIRLPEVIRIKIYDAEGVIRWSDEPRAIGLRFPDNLELQEAFHGEIEVEMWKPRKTEHRYEREKYHDERIVEIYVPLIDDAGSIYGVAEVYKQPASLFAEIRSGRIAVWVISFTGGLILYLSLFWIFRSELRKERWLYAQLLQSERLRSIGQLASGLAHEINNPCGIITSRIEWLIEEAKEQAIPEHLLDDLRVIHRHAHQIAQTTRRLLTFARQSAEPFEPVNLNGIVSDACLLLEKELVKHGVDLEKLLSSVPLIVMGNANQLTQVVLNILTNAREALPTGGRITISAGRLSTNNVYARVTDTGVGIPKESIERIFDPFYTTKPVGEGTGLGLSISYGIIKEHGGTLDVESRVGEGATFTITFPSVVE